MYPQDKSRIVFKPETHEYFLDGKEIPSVSKILGYSTVHPRLNQWIRNRRHDRVAKFELQQKTEQACEHGKSIHDTVEKYVNENLVKNIDHTAPAEFHEMLREKKIGASIKELKRIESVENAFDFMSKNKIKLVETECIIYNEQDWYAGMADVVGRIEDFLTIPDWKTNKCTSSKFEEMKLEKYEAQISLYAVSLGAKSGFVVHLHTGKFYKVTEEEIRKYYAMTKPLIELVNGKTKQFEVSRNICNMWNKGMSIQEITFELNINTLDCYNTVNKYRIF